MSVMTTLAEIPRGALLDPEQKNYSGRGRDSIIAPNKKIDDVNYLEVIATQSRVDPAFHRIRSLRQKLLCAKGSGIQNGQ